MLASKCRDIQVQVQVPVQVGKPPHQLLDTFFGNQCQRNTSIFRGEARCVL